MRSEDDDHDEMETIDDGEDLDEPGEGTGWPSSLVIIVLCLTVASMWHDCFGHVPV